MTDNMTCAACGMELPIERGDKSMDGTVCPACGIHLVIMDIDGDTFDKLEAYAKAKGVTPDQAIAEAVDAYAKGGKKTP